jgi:hypothetical protein
MLSIVTAPPKAVKLSCIELTAPVEVSVDADPNSADQMTPKRVSLPSIAPPAAWGAAPAPPLSASTSSDIDATASTPIAARIA